MRESLVNKRSDAISSVFNNIIKADMENKPEERALKEQQAAYYGAKVREANAGLNARATQASTMADIIKQHLGTGEAVQPWTNPDTGEVVQNTMPSMPLESPEQKMARIQPLIGNAMLAGDKDSADTFRNALGAVYAVGTPDQARTSMTLGGHSITPDFAPDQAEGDRIRQRNADITKNTEIAKANAIPLTDSQVKGKYAQALWDKLSPNQQANFIGANAKNGLNISLGSDGTTSINSGGDAAGSPGDYGAPTGGAKTGNLGPLAPSVRTKMQETTLANNAFKDQLGNYRKVISDSPDENFGVAGNAQLLMGDVATQAKAVGPLLQKFGYKINPETGIDPITQATRQARIEAVKSGISPELVTSMFSGNTKIRQMGNLHNIMLFKGAQALAGQSGRGVSDADIKRMEQIMHDPLGATGGRDRTLEGIDDAMNVLGIDSNAYSGNPQAGANAPDLATSSGVVNTPVPPVENIRTSSMPAANAPGPVQSQITQQTGVPIPAPDPQAQLNTALQGFMSNQGNATPAAAPIQVKSRAEIDGLDTSNGPVTFIDPYGVTRIKPQKNVLPIGTPAPPPGSVPTPQGNGSYGQ